MAVLAKTTVSIYPANYQQLEPSLRNFKDSCMWRATSIQIWPSPRDHNRDETWPRGSAFDRSFPWEESGGKKGMGTRDRTLSYGSAGRPLGEALPVEILEKLHDSEINAMISWSFCGPIWWAIGDVINGWQREGEAKTVKEAISDAAENALAVFPQSKFAKWWTEERGMGMPQSASNH